MEKAALEILQARSQERRKTERLRQHWEEIRGTRRFPSENDIDPDAIAGIWDNCFLLQVRDIVRQDGNFTYLGKQIVDAFRGGISDDAYGRLVSPNIRNLGQNFQTIIETGTPQAQEGEFRNVEGNIIRFRQYLVPLGYQEDKVNAILGCMSLKLYFA